MAEERYNKIRDVLNAPFDIEIHKATFINYLELIIDEEGTPHYAVPSHTEFMMQKGMEKYNTDRQGLLDILDKYEEEHPDELGLGLANLCKMLDCIGIWKDFYMGSPNEKQKETMVRLHNEGLYYGSLS